MTIEVTDAGGDERNDRPAVIRLRTTPSSQSRHTAAAQ